MPKKSDEELYHELMFYTLGRGDAAFLHQNVVDAYTAQHADENTKPMAVVFALVGLYLHVERNVTGRQVQKVHMQMASRRREWPRLLMPIERGRVAVADVVAAEPGELRDALIREWCESVWEAWRQSRPQIAELLASDS
jgi:hypothetical protein